MNNQKPTCKWAFYKGLFHLECHCFLTTTDTGDLAYAVNEIPFDGNCPNCEKPIEQIERNWGRRS